MNMPGNETARSQKWLMVTLWLLLVFYAGANILPAFPQDFSRPVMAASQIAPALLFALIHGAMAYRSRGILAYAAISLTVGYVMEALGVRTGFPFGPYAFTDGMGPKLFMVPILMGPAYLGMGYIAWTLARVILTSGGPAKLTGSWVITVPLSASFVMVAWDLSIDPALSTVGHYWIWPHGGAYFGVPVSNFLGWYLTNYLIYQSFAVYLRRRCASQTQLPLVHAHLVVLFYAVCAAGSVLRAIPTASPALVVDPAGTAWRVTDINGVCALAAIFLMGAFVVLGLACLIGRNSGFPLADLRPGLRYQVAETVCSPQHDEVGQTR
jgi:putative membrane protein